MTRVQNVKKFVTTLYKNLSSKRVIHCINREYPLALPTALLVLGQFIGWASPVTCACLSLTLGILALLKWRRLLIVAALFLAIGGFSTSFIPRQEAQRISWTTQTLVAKIDQAIRHPRAGEMRLSLEVVGSLVPEKNNRFYYFPSNHIKRLQCRTVALPWKNAYHARRGDRMVVRADVQLAPFERSPFSYNSRLLRRGYVGTCRIRYASIVYKAPTSAREKVIAAIEQALGPGDAAAVILAMLLGKRDLMSGRTDWMFKSLGLSHLLVVSGFHVGIFYFFFRTILRLFLSYTIQYLKTFPCIPFIEWSAFLLSIAYVWLTGWGESSIRALIALGCIVLHQLTGRGRPGIFTGVWFALLIFSVIWPTCLAEPGVQFTLSALVAIAVSQTALHNNKLRVCLYPGIATGLVCVCWFDYFPLFSFLFNLTFAPLLVLLVCKGGFIVAGLHLSGFDSGAYGLHFLRELVVYLLSFLRYISDYSIWTIEAEGSRKLAILGLLVGLILWKLYQSYGTFLKQYNVFHYRSR